MQNSFALIPPVRSAQLGLVVSLGHDLPGYPACVFADELGFGLGLSGLDASEPVIMLIFRNLKQFSPRPVWIFALPVEELLKAEFTSLVPVSVLESVGGLAAWKPEHLCPYRRVNTVGYFSHGKTPYSPGLGSEPS